MNSAALLVAVTIFAAEPDATFPRAAAVFEQHCVRCHNADETKGGLDLVTREALLRGGETGAAIMPGEPEKSLLVRSIRHEKEPHMPHKEPKLPDAAIAQIAEWIKAGACDMVRSGCGDVGGLTGLMKCVHLAEAFGMHLEVHSPGVGNLHALGAMVSPGLYYERGLLAPGVDYETPPPYLEAIADPMDAHGYVHLPTQPGMGYRIKWDYIEENRITSHNILK